MEPEEQGNYKGVRGLQTTREEVLRNDDLEAILNKTKGEYYIGYYMPVRTVARNLEKVQPERFVFPSKMVCCLVALLWLFGKRKTEILLLKRRHVSWNDKMLRVRFRVKKKKLSEYRGGVRETFAKEVTLENPYTKYVIDWCNTLGAEDYLFPSKAPAKKEARVRKVTTSWFSKKQGKLVKKTFVYTDEDTNHLTPVMAWKIIKSLDSKAWVHLFRKSLATNFAEEGCTESQLMAWFDWEKADTAQGYVSKGPKLTEQMSKRLW